MKQKKQIIGSRGSQLALWQANFIQQQLSKINIDSEIKIIKTQGDKIKDLSFDKMEGKGFFTKELEEALLAEEIDIAVHSYKDMPTTSSEELTIAAVSLREDPRELLIINKEAVDHTKKFSLMKGAKVGTSSARRKAQLLSFRQDVELKDLRGNVPTRIEKLRNKYYDAILLASAGIERLQLNLTSFHVEKISPIEFVPAPAQGVLAIQVRKSDKELIHELQAINNEDVTKTITVERGVLNLFEGGCQLPLGAYCIKENKIYKLWMAKSTSYDQAPVRLYIESGSNYKLAEQLVETYNRIKPRTVFITKDLNPDNYFYLSLTQNNFTVHGKSLIKTQPLKFSEIPESDWIFFSSPNAVSYFFGQHSNISSHIHVAAIGKGTEGALRRFGYKADFVGQQQNITETGIEFARLAYGKVVLFPKAKDSLRTIQKQLMENTKAIDIDVYETALLEEDFTVPADTNVLVFTSPSNVRSFFRKERINSSQKVIALGLSTAKALEECGVREYSLPRTADEISLTEVIYGLN